MEGVNELNRTADAISLGDLLAIDEAGLTS